MEASSLDLYLIFAVALQINPFFATLLMVVFLSLSGAGIIALLIAPFVGWFSHSKSIKEDESDRNRAQVPERTIENS